MLNTRKALAKAKRLVVKLGTNMLFEGGGLSRGRLKALATQTRELKNRGREILLVSSGAIGVGFQKLGLTERPKTLKMRQACAAVGQVHLMAAWEKALAGAGLLAAQVLISADDLADRARFLNAKHTLLALLERGVVPVINENDTVALDELKVGDNDTLGALVAGLVEADLYVNLSDIDALYSADPHLEPGAQRLSEVSEITEDVLSMAGHSGLLGTGGMYTKVRAAKRLSEQGTASVVASGRQRDILLKILDGQELGTFFKPQSRHRLAGKKTWLAFASRPKGRLTVDEGCAQALLRRGKSLLPGGLKKCEGSFAAGDAVSVVDAQGRKIALGLSNYSSTELEKIMGRPSRQIISALGYSHSDEVIHRDNMVIYEGLL